MTSPTRMEGVTARAEAPLRVSLEPGDPHASHPIALTANDGTDLKLVELRGQVVVEGPLAFTELHLTFDNPEPRVREGRFALTLPESAGVVRLAMELNGKYQDAELVPLEKATFAYEGFVQAGVDPALLRHEVGNRFSARVFPIAGEQRKRLIISYCEELEHNRYRLPLSGLPALETLSVTLAEHTAGRVHHATLESTHPIAPGDFTATLSEASGRMGLRRGDLAVARIPIPRAEGTAPFGSMTIALDTSASGAPGHRARVRALAQLVHALVREQGDFRLRIVAFDQEVHEFYRGRAKQLTPERLQPLAARGALGGTNLGALLEHLQQGEPYARLLLMSDGIDTVGQRGSLPISRLRALDDKRYTRVDVVTDSNARDAALLTALVSERPARGAVLTTGDPKLVQHLLSHMPKLAVEVEGAEEVWHAAQGDPGAEGLLVFARLARSRSFRVRLSPDAPFHEVPLKNTSQPLLDRAFARAKISALSRKPKAHEARGRLFSDEYKASLRESVTRLSLDHHVLSDETGFLVLESEGDYRESGIVRDERARVPHVDGDLVVLKPPAKPQATRPLSRPVDGEEGTIGLGNIGTIGHGGDGTTGGTRRLSLAASGTAHLHAPQPPSARNPRHSRVATGDVTVKGKLSAEVVRRIILRHLNEIRYCHDQVLHAGASLRPRVQARFTVTPTGSVEDVRIAPPGSDSPTLDQCLHRAISRWRFPAPDDDDTVRISQAFELNSAEAGAARPHTPDLPFGRRREFQSAAERAVLDRFSRIVEQARAGEVERALEAAEAFRSEAPQSALPLVAIGEAYESANDLEAAARAYGSLLDLFPGRADMQRAAGQRLQALGDSGLPLAIHAYRTAVALRPDQIVGHRLLAYALLEAGRAKEALRLLLDRYPRKQDRERLEATLPTLAFDLRVLAAAVIAQDAEERPHVARQLAALGLTPARNASTRFVLHWETDASDLNLHVYDGRGGHASTVNGSLPSGGRLLTDVRTGYGPETFAIESAAKGYPYRVQVRRLVRGPEGHTLGTMQVIEQTRDGAVHMRHAPFVIASADGAAELGTVRSTLLADKSQPPAGAP